MQVTVPEIFELDSPTWCEMLQVGLGTMVVPVGVGGGVSRLLVVFRVGPFRFGYADFPVGRSSYDRAELDALLSAARIARVDVLRLHSREPLPWEGRMRVQQVGTCIIPDLQRWQVQAYEKARRTRNRALKSSLRIEPATPRDAARIDALYRNTVDRHHGGARYHESYFRAIAAHTILVARLDTKICAFVSFARCGNVAFYLHGGYDPLAKAQYPSDLLFYTMLVHARAAGAESFDFLPSPPGQDSLLRYKEGWGGRPAPFLVSDIPLSLWRSKAIDFTRKLSNALPRQLISRLLPGLIGRC